MEQILTAIRNVLHAIRERAALTQVVGLVLEQACLLIAVPGCGALFEVDPEKGCLRLASTWGPGWTDLHPGHEIPLGESLLGEVVRDGQPRLVLDAAVQSGDCLNGGKSVLAMPILVEGKVWAVLHFEAFEADSLNEEHLATVSTFAEFLSETLLLLEDLERGKSQGGEDRAGVGPAPGATPGKPAAEQEPLLAMADLIPQIVWTGGSDGSLESQNRYGCDFTGLPPGGDDGLSWQKFLHPDDLTHCLGAWDESIVTGKDYHIEGRIQRADGSYLWHLIRGSPQLDKEGNVVRWIGTCADIHLQKTAFSKMEKLVATRTEELAASEDRFRLIFDHAGMGLGLTTLDGHILHANQAFCSMLGYPEDELSAKTLADITDPEDRAPMLQEFQKLCSGGSRGYQIDAGCFHRENYLIPISMAGSLVRDGQGEPLCVLVQIDDLRERRKLEETHLQAQKVQAMGQLAGGIAHDFNNILTSILSHADMLMEAVWSGADVRFCAEEIRKAGERAAALTQQILAFSRKQTLQPRVFFLNSVVVNMDDMLRRLVGEHIEIRTKLASHLGQVKADPGQVEQVILNLVVNARDAMPQGGQIVIETDNVVFDEEYVRFYPEMAPGEYVMIVVTDTGVGMPPEVQARIFEPFFTTKGVGKGTGLGLSTCYGIVKQSGGHITVSSEPGAGTTFHLYLPQTKEAADEAAAVPKEQTMLRGGNETILFVEDEPMVRNVGIRILTSLGYRIIEAADGMEAIEQLRKISGEEKSADLPLLMVTDVVMPRMGGHDLARQARALLPEMPILFASGYANEMITENDLLEPGTFFLPKPYNAYSLAMKVREVIDDVLSRAPANGDSASADLIERSSEADS